MRSISNEHILKGDIILDTYEVVSDTISGCRYGCFYDNSVLDMLLDYKKGFEKYS